MALVCWSEIRPFLDGKPAMRNAMQAELFEGSVAGAAGDARAMCLTRIDS